MGRGESEAKEKSFKVTKGDVLGAGDLNVVEEETAEENQLACRVVRIGGEKTWSLEKEKCLLRRKLAAILSKGRRDFLWKVILHYNSVKITFILTNEDLAGIAYFHY